MRITIADTTPTVQECWTFWISFPIVLLDEYVIGTKTPRQRLYRIQRRWSRTDRRSNTMELVNVPQPAFVYVHVMNEAKRLLQIGAPNGNEPKAWSDMKPWHNEAKRQRGDADVLDTWTQRMPHG